MNRSLQGLCRSSWREALRLRHGDVQHQHRHAPTRCQGQQGVIRQGVAADDDQPGSGGMSAWPRPCTSKPIVVSPAPCARVEQPPAPGRRRTPPGQRPGHAGAGLPGTISTAAALRSASSSAGARIPPGHSASRSAAMSSSGWNPRSGPRRSRIAGARTRRRAETAGTRRRRLAQGPGVRSGSRRCHPRSIGRNPWRRGVAPD